MAYRIAPPRPRRRNQQFASLAGKLVSLAGLAGQPIVDPKHRVLGSVVDLVFRWDTQEPYPPLSGLIAKVAGRQVWISAKNIAELQATRITLSTTKLDLKPFAARPGEVRLAKEVLDHQLIDVDGARVVRASDLYVATLAGQVRLVGVDISFRSLFRRLGPRSLRSRPTPEVVIDWATIQSFGGEVAASRNLQVTATRNELRRLRPGELADLIEDLGRDERQEILGTLPASEAADVLEEMEPNEVEAVLRESTPTEAGEYLSNMEPDEAADALRDVDSELRDDLLAHMTAGSAKNVAKVLMYDEQVAGGIMNTTIVTADAQETAGALLARLRANEVVLTEIDAVAITDKRHRLLYDLPLVELVLAEPGTLLSNLVQPQAPATVLPDASVNQVAESLIESRRSSILVVNESGRPQGRIFADDIVDALLPESGRFHFPRILS